jgi:putative inorganic carbon (HCO3(-)) transporter
MIESNETPVAELHTSCRSTESRFKKYIFRAYLALLFWVPLPYASVEAWAWALMVVWIFGLALAWLWAFWQGRQQLTPAFHKATPILIIWLTWLCYIALQCIPMPFFWVRILSPASASLHAFSNPEFATLSIDCHSTLSGLFIGIGYVLLFTLTLLLVNSRSRLRWLAYTLVCSGLIQALYGYFMVLGGLEHSFLLLRETNQGVATGTFINRNHLAGYLEMCLPVGIGALIAMMGGGDGPHTWRQRMSGLLSLMLSRKMLLRGCLMLMVIGLVMTRSRTGNTAFFASMLVAGVLTLILSRQTNRSTVILLISLIVIDIFVVSNWFGLDQLAQRIEATDMAGEHGRLIPDQQSLSYWRDYYLTGSGLGSYYVTYFRYEGSVSRGNIQQAHNDYVQFAYETGVVGILLLAAAVLSTYYVALAALRYRHRSWNRGMAFAVVMAITALMIHSDSDFNFQIPANAMTFMVILALGWITRYLPTTHGNEIAVAALLPARSGKKIVLSAMAVLVYLVYVVGCWGYADLLAGEASATKSQRPAGNEKLAAWLDASEHPLAQALRLDPGNSKLWRQMGELYSWRVSNINEPARKKELWRQVLQYQLKSAAQRPASAFIWTDIALTKDRLGEYDATFLAALEKSALLAPWDPSVEYRIAEIGLTSWYRLSDAARQVVIGAIERGMVSQAKPIQELVTRNKREWLVCAYAQPALMTGFCDKLPRNSETKANHTSPQLR